MIASVYKRGIVLSLVIIAISIGVASASSLKEALFPQERIEIPQKAVFKQMLENGLTLLAKESQPQDLVSIDIKIKAGSSLEGEYSGSGISHFVEHMVFKGTRTRRAGDIEKEIKSYGGFINGSVSHDLTGFYVTVPSKYMKEALSLLKDMLLNAVFERSEFEKEREVILKEMKLNRDEPNARLSRLLYDTAYIGHPYKYPVIGYEEPFRGLRREDLIKYYNSMYVPNRIVIAVAGGFDYTELISTIEREFKDFRRADYIIEACPLEPMQIGERRSEQEMAISMTYFTMGFHSTSILDNNLFAMDVLSMILGRGDNSRLNTVLFKEKNLVHSVSSWNYTPKDPGLFVITAALDKENLDAAEKAVLDEIDKIRSDDVRDREIENAKRMVLSDYIFSHQTLDGQAGDLSTNELLTGDYAFSRRYVDGIQAVSKEDVRKAANKILRKDNLTVVKLVPAGSTPAEAKAPGVLSAEPVVKKDILPNGLRILVRDDKKTPTISISVAMLGGLSVENKNNNGISNLAARMLLKGTASRKENDIKGALEGRGGTILPFSGFDSFGVNFTLLKPDFDFALELLKDILTNSEFPKTELDREKNLMLAMMKDEDDDIFERGVRLLKGSLFGSHPYGLRNIGEEESIKSIERDALLNFYNAYCAPNNMVISISGDIEYESAIRKIKDAFWDMKEISAFKISAIDRKADKITSQTLEMEKDQSLVLMGFKTVSIKEHDKYPLDVLGSVLSGYSGRLFSSLRDRNSLAYTLGCVQKRGLDAGCLIFYAATVKDKIVETKKALLNEIDSIKKRPVSDEELILAKRELTSGHKIRTQTNEFFSYQTALDELYGLGYDALDKYEKEINAVTKEDVKRVANIYLDLNACAEVIISSK